jgi:hypothetical protein
VPTTAEALSGAINLHKIAKTGTYSDLIDAPPIEEKQFLVIPVVESEGTYTPTTTNTATKWGITG